jgi:hypothetical protein
MKVKIFGETLELDERKGARLDLRGLSVGVGFVSGETEPGYPDYYYPVVGDWRGLGKQYKTAKLAAKAVEKKLMELKEGIYRMQQLKL